MGFMDKIKAKADEYDLQGKAERAAAEVEKVAKQATEKAGEVAHDNREKVSQGLDKAGTAIDSRTDGKYADKVAKAKQGVAKGVDKLAEQRADGTNPADGGPVAHPDPAAPAADTAAPIDRPEPLEPPIPTDPTAPPTWGPPNPPAQGTNQG